jgi:hypothetical protein
MRKTKQNIELLQEFAENKDGKLISTEYINNKENLIWECKEKHQWEANWNNVHQGSWCPTCFGNSKPVIEVCQEFALNKDGKLISTEYINNNTKMLWECEEGHQWEVSWNNVHQGSWCPYCARKAKPDIIELQNFAKNKEGKLISDKYINNNTKMLWECKEKHQWEATWNSINSGNNWCPECASFKTEYKCKELLEQTFGFEFKKTRFYYANNNKHKYFEFDGYNKENKIAFEYHGYQHYIFPNFFQKTLEIHENAKQRDMDKVIYAKENNIKLIIIPYTEEKNLESYIKEINNG